MKPKLSQHITINPHRQTPQTVVPQTESWWIGLSREQLNEKALAHKFSHHPKAMILPIWVNE